MVLGVVHTIQRKNGRWQDRYMYCQGGGCVHIYHVSESKARCSDHTGHDDGVTSGSSRRPIYRELAHRFGHQPNAGCDIWMTKRRSSQT